MAEKEQVPHDPAAGCEVDDRRAGSDRRVSGERRAAQDRRKTDQPVATERRKGDRRESVLDRRLGLDRRRGPGVRRSADRRSAEEGEMTEEQFEFIMAIDRYKRANGRPFPSWTEVLDVIRALGYRKVAEPEDLR